jgi:hypothetical protein
VEVLVQIRKDEIPRCNFKERFIKRTGESLLEFGEFEFGDNEHRIAWRTEAARRRGLKQAQ